MNKIIISTSKKLVVCLILVFPWCYTLAGNANQIENGEVAVVENIRAIDKFDFYQQEDSLILEISLKNVTDSAIEVPINAKPFWVYKDGKHIRTVTKIHLYGDEYRSQYVSIEPNEVYKYHFIVSYLYYLDKGLNDYKLYYVNNFYNVDFSSLSKDDLSNPEIITTISFTWYREEDSDKGTLISSDFKPTLMQ